MSLPVLNWVLENSPVDRPSDRLVLVVLASHADKYGADAFPSAATIARKARLSKRRVYDSLGRLKAAGHIEVIGRSPRRGVTGQTSVSYRVLMTDERGDILSPLRAERGDISKAEGVTFRSVSGDIPFNVTVQNSPEIESAPGGAHPSPEGAAPPAPDSGRTGSRAGAGRRPTSPGSGARLPRHPLDPEKRAAYEALESHS